MHVPEGLRDGLVDARSGLPEPVLLEHLALRGDLRELLAEVLALLRRDLRRLRKGG